MKKKSRNNNKRNNENVFKNNACIYIRRLWITIKKTINLQLELIN